MNEIPGPGARRGGRPAPASPGRGLRAVLAAAAWTLLLTCSLPAAGQAGADGAAGPLAAQEPWEELFEDWVGHDGSRGYYTWVDEQGRRITYTAIAPAVGDEYITADNRLYEVTAVEENRTVRARFVEEVELSPVLRGEAAESRPARVGPWAAFWPFGGAGRSGEGLAASAPAQARGEDQGPIGIYHSHNAESYIETSNDAFTEPHGDIVEVGRALQEALERQGYEVIHSTNSHLPHDGGAYQRSRATVRELLEQGAVALIDVHRDAIPAEVYRTEVAGEEMTKVRLVVGRQNPNREANLELAKRVKALADEQYPGLVKGIFHARGNYNQDVGPRTLLLEFGTHETSLDEAIRSTKFIAEIFPAAAGLASGTGEAASAIGGAGLRSALWLLLLAGAAVFAYLWINEGTPQGAWRRLKGFFRREAGRAAARSRRGGDGEAG